MKWNTPFSLDILPYSAKESNRLSTVQMKRHYKHIVLSIMTITRVRQSHFARWETDKRRHPCSGKWSNFRVWDLYWEYAGGGWVTIRRDSVTAVPANTYLSFTSSPVLSPQVHQRIVSRSKRGFGSPSSRLTSRRQSSIMQCILPFVRHFHKSMLKPDTLFLPVIPALELPHRQRAPARIGASIIVALRSFPRRKFLNW